MQLIMHFQVIQYLDNNESVPLPCQWISGNAFYRSQSVSYTFFLQVFFDPNPSFIICTHTRKKVIEREKDEKKKKKKTEETDNKTRKTNRRQ